MTFLRRFLSSAWLAAPVCAFALIIWIHYGTGQRVLQVSHLVDTDAAVDPRSPTGYAQGRRALLLSERMHESMSWPAQTQEMIARGEWRLRRITYENAPAGRDVLTTSPYRWWLALCAGADRAFFGTPLGLAVERTVLWADPALHALLLLVTCGIVAWRFSLPAATLVSLAVATLFPFGTAFLPGVPSDDGLALACALVSILLLFAGYRMSDEAESPMATATAKLGARRLGWFAAAGVVGGVGVWISAPLQFGIIFGLALGGAIAGRVFRTGGFAPDQWRIWSWAGAATVLGAYWMEYSPDHLGGWNVAFLHPVHGIAWIGLGELAALLGTASQVATQAKSVRWARLAGAFATAVCLPLALWKSNTLQFFAGNMMAFRLTKQPDGAFASSSPAWLLRDGYGLTFWATVLPVGFAALAAATAIYRQREPRIRFVCTVLFCGLVTSSALAMFQLRYWQLSGVVSIALLVPLATRASVWRAPRKWLLGGAFVCALAPSLVQMLPSPSSKAPVLALSEVQGLLERDFAHWLSHQISPDQPSVILAPPSIAATLSYYGGLPGIATFSPENQQGLAGAARIASATSGDEARALIEGRQITHIVLPSWDTFLADVVKKTPEVFERSFINALHRWALPPWLRPVPYQFPQIAGLEEYSVVVFEVVENQDEALGLSRLAEYFVETGRLDLAVSVAAALERYPADVGALTARAQVDFARRDTAGVAEVIGLLNARLARSGDRFLRWDRRVSLAIVLAREQRMNEARSQVERCLKEITVSRVKTLTTGSLFNLSILAKAFGIEISDSAVTNAIREKIPSELRKSI